MKKCLIMALAIALLMTGYFTASAGQDSTATTKEPKAQTTCPVMGGKIDKKIFLDVKGFRIYLCCSGCAGKVKADPDKYIEKIKVNGENPEKAPANEKRQMEAKK